MLVSTRLITRPWFLTAIAVTVGIVSISTFSISHADVLDNRRDEEKALLEQQRQTDAQLDAILQMNGEGPFSTTQRAKLLQRSQTLNLMRETISARLKDIQLELRNAAAKQVSDLFAGTFDIYMEGAELTAGKPSVHGATLDRKLEFNGHTYVRLFVTSGWCVIDPAKIDQIVSGDPASGWDVLGLS